MTPKEYASRMKYLKVAGILFVVGVALCFVPVIGWLGIIPALIGLMMFIGFFLNLVGEGMFQRHEP